MFRYLDIEIGQENLHVNMMQPYLSIFVQLFSTYFLFFVSVNDYEDQIQKKTQDMDQQVQLVSDLDSEVKRLQVSQTD